MWINQLSYCAKWCSLAVLQTKTILKRGRPAFLKGAIGLSISLDARSHEAVRRIAERRGVSLATIVRDAVDRYLERPKEGR